jgi:hypothetical protein
MEAQTAACRRRTLRATPSNAQDLAPWQTGLLGDLGKIMEDCQEQRKPIAYLLQPAAPQDEEAAMRQFTGVWCQVFGTSPEVAEAAGLERMAPGPATASGTLTTTPLSWRYDDESLWRGPPDNRKVIKLARSIVITGFRQSDPLTSRTLDLSPRAGEGGGPDILSGRLLFGDGSARGLAAFLVWQLLWKKGTNLPTGDAALVGVVESLVAMPTVFELHGDGSKRAMAVAQAI